MEMILTKILKLIALSLMLFPMISGCTQRADTVNTAGSTTVLPIVQAAAEIFMSENPKINISVRGGGSSIGIKSAINQTIDIGNSSRRIAEQEADLIDAKKTNLIETAIARDAISIVVHKSNPVNDLTLEQLKGIYSGVITNWQEVGGSKQKIVVVSRDFSSGSFLVFNEVVLDSIYVKENSMRLASNNAVATMVGYTPGAIGYIGLGYVNDKLKTLAVNGVYPNPETVLNNQYKLSRLLYMYTSENPRQAAQDFIDFILSEKGQQIVEEQGYVRIR